MILKNGKRIDGCSDTVPIGTLNPYVGSTAPYGYLLCQGQLVSKTTYRELYEICGNTFGTATATEFYLPDLRGRTIVGYKEGDTNFGTLGGLVGSVTSATGNHTLTIDEIPKHTHTQNQWIFNGSSASGTHYGYGWQSNTGSMYNGMPSDWSSNGQTGGGGAHNHGSVSTIQPSINLNWIVKAFMLMPNQSYVANTAQESSVNTYSCDYINDKFTQGNLIKEVKITSSATSLDLTDLHLQPGNSYKIIIAEYCTTSTGSGHCLVIDDATTGYIGWHSYAGTNYTSRVEVQHTQCLAWVNGWGVGAQLCFTEAILHYFNKDWISVQAQMNTSALDNSSTLNVFSASSYNMHEKTEINTLKVKPRDNTLIGTGSYMKVYKL